MSFHYGLIKDVFVQAYYALGDNMLRTTLSILGVAIGICVVMAVGTVLQGAKTYIYKELETYGLKSIWVYRDWGDDQPNKIVRQGSGITNENFRKITGGCCSAILRATPIVYSEEPTNPINSGSETFQAPVEGVGVEYLAINNNKLSYGRNFRRDDILRRKPVAIIGPKVVKALYGKSGNVIGKSFRFMKQKFTVIGVLKEVDRSLLTKFGADTYDVNSRVLIPYTTYQNYFGVKDIHTLQAEVKSMEVTKLGQEQVVSLLNRSHANRYDYITESMDEWIAEAEWYLSWFSLGGYAFSALCLLVGGIGIMNIMSTSVIERTREIGIRKAIGAQSQDILAQFLMEAIFVSIIGGIIGLLLGLVMVSVISIVSGFNFPPSWLMGIISILVSVIVGIMSGYYPAYRASRMKPVDALRYE